MAKQKNSKKKVMDVLDKHPEGLTIQRVSMLTKMSRITATKYIHELIGEGRIRERKIGAYRLLFSKEKFLMGVREEYILKKLKRRLK